jgi:hypothetical protein
MFGAKTPSRVNQAGRTPPPQAGFCLIVRPDGQPVLSFVAQVVPSGTWAAKCKKVLAASRAMRKAKPMG